MNMQNSRFQNGVIDLSSLGAKPATAVSSNSPFVVDVSEANFEPEVLLKSKQLPVIVCLGSNRHAPSVQVTSMLEKLTIEYKGKVCLARVDTDVNPQIAMAFQTQTVPAVYLVLNGQVQPLFNDVPTEPQARSIFEQIIEVAAKAGMNLKNDGDDATASNDEVEIEKPVDPRFVKAFEAMEAGEWDTADAVFREVLKNSPADEEAKIGVVQVGLFKRTDGIDFDAVIGKSLDDSATYLEVADALMMLGQVAPAFDLLVAGVRNFSGAERDEIKARLLDFFALIGEDEVVRTARKQLTNALF